MVRRRRYITLVGCCTLLVTFCVTLLSPREIVQPIRTTIKLIKQVSGNCSLNLNDISSISEGELSEAAACLHYAGVKKAVISKENVSGVTRGGSSVACALPKLDPYQSDAAEYKDSWREESTRRCDKQRFGNVIDNKLHIKIADVNTAILYAVRRPDGDDFREIYVHKRTLTNHPEVRIETDKTGCLLHRQSHFILQGGSGDSAWFVNSTCVHHNLFHFKGDGTISVVDTKHCLKTRGKEPGADVGFSSSCDGASRFEVIDGQVIDTTSGYCLGVSADKKMILKRCIYDEDDNTGDILLLEAEVQDIDEVVSLDEDYYQVDAYSDGSMHKELYSVIVPKESGATATNVKPQADQHRLNVILLLMESQSAANVERSMHETYTYLNELQSFFFKGHAIVGDGTTAQLCAMLTGEREEKLPESRRGRPNSKSVDNWPFIFKDAKAKGYATLYTEDDPSLASFNLRLLGFVDPPTDHYSRPFWIAANHWDGGQCILGKKRSIDYLMEEIRDFHKGYRVKPRLSVSMISKASHSHSARIKVVDAPIMAILKDLNDTGHLNNTILLVAGDHGPRVSGTFRSTIQGKLEERLPFLSITVPNWLLEQYPYVKSALSHNVNVLTSHFDIHATLRHILDFPKDESKRPLGSSLFRKLDANTRTCKSAGVDDHWCPCLSFDAIRHDTPVARRLAGFVVHYINKQIIQAHSVAKDSCARLSLNSVSRAGMRQLSKKVEKFSGTMVNDECDSCAVTYEGEELIGDTAFEVVFSVDPSDGLFEATVYVNGRRVFVDPNISRINAYGNQPKCVHSRFPFLSKFCYCK